MNKRQIIKQRKKMQKECDRLSDFLGNNRCKYSKQCGHYCDLYAERIYWFERHSAPLKYLKK